MRFDGLLLVSFGGPEGPEEVMPFLDRVLRGRPVPRERLEAVAAHYLELGGVSPINGESRALLAALRDHLAVRRADLRLYWGNRNAPPFLTDALTEMRDDGVRRAAAFVTSAYSSYSSCRQYIADIEAAAADVGEGAPGVVKLRPFFDHPGFVAPLADGLRAALVDAGPDAAVLMTAHSLPSTMAQHCDYEKQLQETARLVAAGAGVAPDRYRIVYQSRSGPPTQPWLEPDVNDAIVALPPGAATVVVVPIGFVSDHMEVVYDLDRQAAATAAERGVRLVRSATPGTHPAFVEMIVDLVEEAESLPAPSCPCPVGCLR